MGMVYHIWLQFSLALEKEESEKGRSRVLMRWNAIFVKQVRNEFRKCLMTLWSALKSSGVEEYCPGVTSYTGYKCRDVY